MKQNTRLPTLLIPLAGLLTLVVAAALDYGLYRLRLQASQTFQFRPYVLSLAVAGLLIASLLLGVTWFVLRTKAPSWVAGLVLLVLGLPPALTPLLFTLGVVGWLPGPVEAAGDHFRLTGAFLAVLGLYLIVQWSRERE